MKLKPTLHCVLRVLLPVTILLTVAMPAVAQLTMQQIPFGNGRHVDDSGYPRIRMQFRALRSTQPIQLTAKDIVLQQLNRIYPLTSLQEVTPGTYVAEFFSHPFSGSVTLFATSRGETGRVAGNWTAKDPPQYVEIFDSMSRRVPYVFNMGTVPAGTTDTLKVKLCATSSPRNGSGGEFPVNLVSVTMMSGKFDLEWKGWLGNSPAPPLDMVPAFEYRVHVICKPTTDDYVEDVIVAEYANGLKAYALITANTKPIVPLRLMKLLYPNGGEALAPCDTVQVRWTGTQSSFTSYVEYSINDGLSWRLIDSTQDTTLQWVVPPSFTDKARVRVYQKYRIENSEYLIGEASAATTVAFSPNSRHALISYANGVIQEFDVASGRKEAYYKIDVAAGSKITALCYIGTTRNIMAVVNKPTGGGEIFRFANGTTDPAGKAALPTDITVRTMGTDVYGDNVYLGPRKYGKIVSYGVENLLMGTPIVPPAFIGTSRVADYGITCMLTDGTVIRYDMSTGTPTINCKTSIFRAEGAMPDVVNIDAGGRQAVIGCANVNSTVIMNEQRTYVVDLADGQVRRVVDLQSGTPVSNLAFTKSGTYIVGAFSGATSEIYVYDIVTGTRQVAETGQPQVQGKVSGMEVSPDFAYRITISESASGNALLVRTSAPDEDQSDTTFEILPARFSSDPIVFDAQRIGTTHDTVITTGVCNVSRAAVVVRGVHLAGGKWATILNDVKNDTLQPGECLTLEIRITPNDTGVITDNILLETCNAQSSVPMQIRGIDRKFELVADLTNFGDICAGKTTQKNVLIVRNLDDIPVVVNAARMLEGLASQFLILNPPRDTVLPPGGEMYFDIVFAPVRVGQDTGTLQVLYAGQENVRKNIRLVGRGSGADIYASHMQLPFIPEIPEREIVLYNRSENPVTLADARISANSPFTIVTNLPVEIPSRDSVRLKVRYDGGDVPDTAGLSMEFEPCAYISRIPLSLYKATVIVSAPVVTADVRGDAVIPITVGVVELIPYKGVRFFDAVIDVNERLFFGRTVESSVGAGTIVSQDVENGIRHVRVRIEGDFRDTFEVARITGPAGLAEVNTCPIAFNPACSFGAGTTAQYRDGTLLLTNPNPGRYVRVATQFVSALAPNPATETMVATVASSAPVVGSLRVVNGSGTEVMNIPDVRVTQGTASIPVHVSDLAPGMYTLLWVTPDATSPASFVVVR